MRWTWLIQSMDCPEPWPPAGPDAQMTSTSLGAQTPSARCLSPQAEGLGMEEVALPQRSHLG
jgi:hypothetical protein